jgi:uncharacterized repeat protein (TIGR03803 family)
MNTEHVKTARHAIDAVAISALVAIAAACSPQASTLGPPVARPGVHRQLGNASGQEQVLYSFSGGVDGGNAATGLVLDSHGNLYGTTVVGGTQTCGTVFELSPNAESWQETVLYNFGCFSDGKNPHGGVTFDKHGTLYGTTVSGGSGSGCDSYGCGVVFALNGQSESVLHSFTGGKDGFGPGGGVVVDGAGNLFGTTPDGGAHSWGVVYQVSPHGQERVIHAFNGKDGAVGSLGLLLDVKGRLYGVTELGGANNAGTVFELSKTATKRWKLKTLYAFKGAPDAGSPYGGLVADASGDLFGTTYYGGTSGLGSVFELKSNGKGAYHERVLYSFQGGNDGSGPTSTLVLTSAGDLYGTTSMGGGTCDCGTLFSVNAMSRKEQVLHAFGASGDGAYPYYGLVQNASGTFFGTTVAGGNSNQGAVFSFTP